MSCEEHDDQLIALAKKKIKRPNVYICICRHCHAQCRDGKPVPHKITCCWHKPIKLKLK